MHFLCVLILLFGSAPQTPGGTPPQKSDTHAPDSAGEPLITLPVLPKGKISILGGTLERVDSVHDQLLVRTFGGKSTTRIAFDTRTLLFDDDLPIELKQLKPGMALSVDTLAVPNGWFAKTVRIHSVHDAVELRGQVVSYDSSRSEAVVRDEIVPQEVRIKLSAQTALTKDGQPTAASALRHGDLVRVWLSSSQLGAADRIEILAQPGSVFTFAGTLTALDLRARRMSIMNQSDAEIHEVSVERIDQAALHNLHEGSEVQVEAEFDGSHYNARSISATQKP